MTTEQNELQQAYLGRTAEAQAWKASGGRVVGYVCDNVPVELIRAAGFLPFRLSGDSSRSREEIARLIAPVHSRRFAGNEFVEAIYAGLADGSLGFLDYLVVPHNRKSVQSIVQSVEILRRVNPQMTLPETYFLDRTYARTFLTGGYNRRSFFSFAEQLAEWAGRPIDEATLDGCIAEANETRGLLRDLNALRVAPAPLISGSEALVILGASHYLPPAKFNNLLRARLDEVRRRSPLPGIRLYLGGSPVDHVQLYELVESCGALIVAEDHCWGARCGELDPAPGKALDALARRFDHAPACSLLTSIDDTINAVVNRCVQSRADAAIFSVIKGDASQMWETPSEIDALAARGIPSLHLQQQPYRIEAVETLRESVSAFLKTAVRRDSYLPVVDEGAGQ